MRLRRVRARRDHEDPLGDQDDRAVLFDAALAYGDDAPPRTGARRARLDHLGVGIERVAFEERIRQRDLTHPEREPPAARLGDHHPRDRREREEAVHQRTFELGLRGVVRVDVDLVRIVREQRELDVVGLGDGATDR